MNLKYVIKTFFYERIEGKKNLDDIGFMIYSFFKKYGYDCFWKLFSLKNILK